MIKNVSIIGMGALGLMYADVIAKAEGYNSVTFVMDSERVEKYQNTTFSINGDNKKFNIISMENACEADLLIVAVKYNSLPSAYPIIRKCVGQNTIVLSVMNGISSEQLIKENCDCNNIIYTVAQGMDAMKFGNELKYTKMGELHIGVLPGENPNALNEVCDYFSRISMPFVKEDDILYRLWFKFMLNVGINQICMIDEVGYGIATTEGTMSFMMLVSAMREVVAIANAKGIRLTEQDIITAINIIRTLDPNGTPSMGQDRISKRPSEVDMFAGTVIELGKENNILVPVNKYIYQKVKEIEACY